uniref:Putative anti-proliferation factor btg1/tob n=1 Tax=Panstrongylus lignarius TaxID=156445 RepID=A0A224XS76_9HEMI
MRDEISAAVLFLARLIEKSENFNQEQLKDFKDRLSELLQERFENHWFPDKPDKGQGYRCIRVNGVNRRDPTLEKAANACGIKYEDMKLPFELTIWVDPNEVCCRFGESKGSFCTLASFCDKESLDSSSGSEESSEDSLKGNSPSPLSTPTKQSLQMSVREKPGVGGLVRLRSRGDTMKSGNGNNRGRRGYYQYHHHHHHHHHHQQQQQQQQQQHNQPWYSLISPPWMGPHHNNSNSNNNNNSNNNSSTTTSSSSTTSTSTTNTTTVTTITTQNNVTASPPPAPLTTQQYHHNNNNLRTRWTSSAAAHHHHHHHHNHRYDSATQQKSALKV